MPSYHVGNSSPLRTHSPKRSADANSHQQTYQPQQQASATFNVTQVNKQQVMTSSEQQRTVSHNTLSYGAGGNCAGAPTEKERMIA